jgi:hypothetical protein
VVKCLCKDDEACELVLCVEQNLGAIIVQYNFNKMPCL